VIAAGADDRIATPARQSVRLHGELSGSELMLLPRAGHMLHYAAPTELAEAVGRM
jgi:pimeloyl-ACP methyl ester carboxylesterase